MEDKVGDGFKAPASYPGNLAERAVQTLDEGAAVVECPRWSIVIPAYNAAPTLGEQLTALGGELPARGCEVIVADHGSSDATAAIAHKYADVLPQLRVVDVPRDHVGPGHARNVGAAHSRGDIIIFVDADDIVAPGWFAALSSAAEHTPLVGGNVDFAWLAGGMPAPGAVPGRVEPAWDRLPAALKFLSHVSTANAAVRRDVFFEVGGFDTAYEYVEDVVFSWRVQLAGYDITFARDSVVWYRRRKDLVSLWRQQYNHGGALPQVYLEFREYGARRGRLLGVGWEYLRLLIQLPIVLVVGSRRPAWVSRLGFAMGQLSGSIRRRVLCL